MPRPKKHGIIFVVLNLNIGFLFVLKKFIS